MHLGGEGVQLVWPVESYGPKRAVIACQTVSFIPFLPSVMLSLSQA